MNNPLLETAQRRFTELMEKAVEIDFTDIAAADFPRSTAVLAAELAECHEILRSMTISLSDGQLIFGPDLDALTDFARINEQTLQTMYSYNDLEFGTITLSPAGRVIGVNAAWIGGVTDLEPLARLERLSVLVLSKNQVSDLTPLAGLSRLEHLDLSSNSISDLTPITQLKALKTLDLELNRISDLEALAALTQLTELHVSRNCKLDLTPLKALSNLRSLTVDRKSVGESVSELKNFLPQLRRIHTRDLVY